MTRYQPGIIKCPTGKYAFVGHIPVELSGVVFDTEEMAIKAALKFGLELIQLSDCSTMQLFPLKGTKDNE